MKKFKILCVIFFVAILSVSVCFIFQNDEQQQVNANQDENCNRNERNGDETEVSKPQVEMNYIDDEEKNDSKDKIVDDKSETEVSVIVDSKPIISSNEAKNEDVKADVSVDINVSEDSGEDGNTQDEEVEFRDDFVDWENMTDSDNDELPDTYENDIGTDIHKSDTDGDGLTDGYENLYSATNPLSKYSLDNGIIDAELDLDNDGLSTIEECEYETDPLEVDTDFDGLLDGDEVKIHGTSPLLYDTDDDTLCDGIEIKMRLSPVNAFTYGYDDKKHSCKVNIENDSEVLSQINHNNDEYQLSITMEGSGQAFSDIIVRESAYTDVIESEYVLGIIPEIMCYEDECISSIVLEFEISDNNINREQGVSAYVGVNKYSIFKYDEEEKTLYPINTYNREDDNVIGAVTNEIGTYCIINMEKWLDYLGFDVVENDTESYSLGENTIEEYSLEEIDELSEKSTDDNLQVLNAAEDEMILISKEEWTGENITPFTISEPEVSSEKNIDIVFSFNNHVEKLSNQEFTAIKDNIVVISEYLFNGSESARVYIIDQYGELVCASAEQDYANDIYQVKEMVNKLSNVRYVSGYLDTQVNTLINSITLRDDARRVFVFLENAWCSNPEMIYEYMVNREIQSIIISPQTQEGSFYYKMATETNGMLLFNYFDFSKKIIKHIYGYLPTIPYIPYTVVSSTGLKVVMLKDEIKKDGKTKSDTDELSDWEEISQDKVIINDDGSVTLPDYWDYLYTYFPKKLILEWVTRYSDLRNKDGKTLKEMLSEVYVLPIISDPTKDDSDGDGIKDDEEVVWNGIDERYKDLSPLHKDTVETLFPEIVESGYNNRANATYISVDGNDVVLHVKAYFTGEPNAKVSQYLKTTELSQKRQEEADNIKSRLGEDFTFKELIIDGVQSRWNGVYRGSSYDFCPGVKVNFAIDFIEDYKPEWGERSIEVNVKNGVCGVSEYEDFLGWNTNCKKIITIYTNDCYNPMHQDKNVSECDKNEERQYDIAQYSGATAHEFGHAFGLADMYDDAYCNHGYEPISNDELKYDKSSSFIPVGKGIMMISGEAVTNDIEMILLAFCENKKQFYVPFSTSQKVSKAIKSEVLYSHKLNPGIIYRWNQVTSNFKLS